MLALFIVCIGIGSAGYAAFWGDRIGCVVVSLLGLLWLFLNKPVEGAILVQLSHGHGITVADLFSVACFGLAIHGWNRRTRARERERERHLLELGGVPTQRASRGTPPNARGRRRM